MLRAVHLRDFYVTTFVYRSGYYTLPAILIPITNDYWDGIHSI